MDDAETRWTTEILNVGHMTTIPINTEKMTVKSAVFQMIDKEQEVKIHELKHILS